MKFPAPDGLTLRDATPEDIGAVVDIHNASIPGRMASAYLRPVTVEERREWFDAHSPDSRPLLVACDADGKVVAWGCLSKLFQREAYDITAEASVYVLPTLQSRGVGTWIFSELIARCPALGVERVVSLVFSHNLPSLRMHEKLGFDQWGTMPGVCNMDGVRRDVVMLGLRV